MRCCSKSEHVACPHGGMVVCPHVGINSIIAYLYIDNLFKYMDIWDVLSHMVI